jgi:DNA-binding phage protein
MMPFRTTPEQRLKLAQIVVEMQKAKLDPAFIDSASELARLDQGVFDLVELWQEAKAADKMEILADIQDSLDDYADAPLAPQEKPYIAYDQLSDVAVRVIAEKAKLRTIIDQHGGVSAVAHKTGIPQPSLSRMLNSASIPRRTTLYKIAKALRLSETDIVMEWTR